MPMASAGGSSRRHGKASIIDAGQASASRTGTSSCGP